MGRINDLGAVYTSDVLVIGGSMSGLLTAIKAKEMDPSLNILVVEKGYSGFSGQASRAGHGIRTIEPGTPLDQTAKHLVETHTPYMNDQEFLKTYLSRVDEGAKFVHKCGVEVSKNPDGSMFTWNKHMGLYGGSGIDITVNRSLRRYALAHGVRILSKVNIFELLTEKDGNRVIGAIGFDMNYGKCHIFNAKAVCLCTHGAHFKKMGGMFMAYGTGLMAAFRVGAVMRNAEFSTQVDMHSAKTNVTMHGCFNILRNSDEENISYKYAPSKLMDGCCPELMMGMLKEIADGKGPIHIDLNKTDEYYKFISSVAPEPGVRVLPTKFRWAKLTNEMMNKYISDKDVGSMREMTVHHAVQVEALRVDQKYATNVPGLFAAGKITAAGCAYFGWTHGDGIGNASTTAMFAGESVAEYAQQNELKELDYDQVEKLKEKIYAPLYRTTNRSPKEIWDRMEEYALDTYTVFAKNGKTIAKVLEDIERMKKIVPELKADDPHTLAKCHEAADSLSALEMVFRAADMRKETRGLMYPHYRTDYPEKDDKNWLKWINIRQAENGEMELYTEDIPLWRYPVRPEGYVIPEGHKEEYYV